MAKKSQIREIRRVPVAAGDLFCDSRHGCGHRFQAEGEIFFRFNRKPDPSVELRSYHLRRDLDQHVQPRNDHEFDWNVEGSKVLLVPMDTVSCILAFVLNFLLVLRVQRILHRHTGRRSHRPSNFACHRFGRREAPKAAVQFSLHDDHRDCASCVNCDSSACWCR